MDVVEAELEWTGDVSFAARAGRHQLVIDGDSAAGTSPMQQVALGVAGCMGIDVVHILRRMRTAPDRLSVAVRAERAGDEPRRFTRIELSFEIEGEVPEANLERALKLSRERYCSAWATIRPDTELVVRTRINRPRPA